MVALFLACTVLAGAIDKSNIVIGAMVGVVFFTGICLSPFSIANLAGRFGCRDPSALGTAMILFGLFYLLSPLVIPAYMQAQTVPVPAVPIDMGETLLSAALMAALGIIGFAGHRYRRSNE